MKKPLYQQIASSLQAMINCEKSGNSDWYTRHQETIEDLCKNHMPAGSGFDAGTQLDFDRSTPEKLVFISAYHHMDENGFYDGWSDPVTVTVRPSLAFGILISISGIRRKNRYEKDYFYDTFDQALHQEVKNPCS